MSSVRKAWKKDTAAVICEPIQSVGGVFMAPVSFYQELRQFCDKKNILLIFDEVQTGLGRTGTFWFAQNVGISPDMITTAKGLASGLPLSVVLVKKEIGQAIQIGEHATTFGGGALVCTASLATLNILLQKGFLQDVNKKSEYIISKLKQSSYVQEVRGRGLLLGIQIKPSGADAVKQCIEKGLIIGTSGDRHTVRILPPLNISFSEIDLFLNIFLHVLGHTL